MKPITQIITLLSALLFLIPAPLIAGEEILIHAVGDIMLAGRWAPTLRKLGYDHPFAAVRSELAWGDINLANLESPISTKGREFTTKKFRFRAEPAVAKAIKKAGFNLVTLGNNHSMDFGGAALLDTLTHLKQAEIGWVGAGSNLEQARQMSLQTIKEKKIAFLGYSLTQPLEFFATASRPGTAPGYEKLIVQDVAAARKQADYVIVSIHWGKEGSGQTQAYQRKTAHSAIDAGADAIIGHHPHVLQGVERYKSGIIFYSLGNFTFASKSKTAANSAIIRLWLGDKQKTAEVLPLDVLHSRVGFQPRILSGNRANALVDGLEKLSAPFGTQFIRKNGRYFLTF